MKKTYLCAVCDQPEGKCLCDKFCAFCHNDYGVRLCDDGQYYCQDCREACDYKTQDED